MSEMRYRPLGRCGTKVSELSLGGWTTYGGSVTEGDTIKTIIEAAYEAGVNFFDIADIYAKGECERVMGAVLGGLPRHELVISTKVFWPMSEDVNDRGLSRKHILESCDKSLQRLGTDYVDLYFCHRFDPETPLLETVLAMDHLVRQGKVLYWGTSEWTGEQLREACRICDERGLYRPQVEQPQYNLMVRGKVEQDVAPAADEHGMGLVCWSPLASGFLTGKYDDGVPDDSRLARIDWLRERFVKDELIAQSRAFGALADKAGCTRAQLALAWCARHPQISSVITGATRKSQLEDNLGALALAVDDALAAELDALFPPDAPAPA